ncbi:timeless protein-domain-containing protein [Calycina marina]|uniref:Topoisomerase 1-associated factor 1 n=1 Tax=Calycina marina TaxID=1763456 RepID=A0A9P8CFF7_9HELO|nr:timeless protein-domain-containing protein [Calycina marina]
MDFGKGQKDVVDPEVRAYISSLVSALGGSGADEDGRYILGDDALACLRDLKKWLKLYDEKANRLDVARCLAESNLVGGDLIPILGSWQENASEDRLKLKTSLACLEVLVPLTWPLEKTEMTVNHYRHIPYLQLAHLGYKRSLINYDAARILNTAVRCALPSMAEPMKDRGSRDEGIIKLLLYFLRNIAMIAPPPNIHYEGDEAEISRSATIGAFDYQDIFQLLLTVCSTIGEEFIAQDVIVMDVLFHVIKGVDIEKLFMEESKASNSKVDELARLRKKEAAMLREYQKDAPSRHGRFGAMVWLQRENHKNTVISGQAALTSSRKGLAVMDAVKTFKPPRRALKGDNGPMDFDTSVSLNVQATKYLRSFVGDFLDSGFNPLFNNVRKAIEREAERIMDYHPRQFFYLVSWFLEAERIRRRNKKSASGKNAVKPEDLDTFALVASVLNQEMFVTLNRAMDASYENKSWADLSAAMRCFTQILLTVQEMSESPLEEDQEISENILNRIFYEETTHDRVANITRSYKDQGFGYLDACTELTHNYMRILEQYSKQNVDMQVRSKRRVRRKKKAAAVSSIEDDNNDVDESDGEDEARVQKTSHERRFDFTRFASRFVTQGCVDTFVSFTKYYDDLKPAQLKRSHRFFYRVAFKQEMSVMLFRVDIMSLFHKMIKGPGGLDSHSSQYTEWYELVKQLIKRCTRKMQERPELVAEMLFSKINSTAHFLEYGYEKQTISTRPRAAAELEVKPGKEWDEQVAIVVSAILDRNENDLIQWTKAQLINGASELKSWEGANQPLPSVEAEKDLFEDDETLPAVVAEAPKPPLITLMPGEEAIRIAIFKNGHLRLLMTLVGFQRLGSEEDPKACWIIPSMLTADQLQQSIDLISKAEFSPPVFDDGQEAADFIRRKPAVKVAARKRQPFDDEDDALNNDEEDKELMFAPGGPKPMNRTDALKALKKTRRKRRREGSEEGIDNNLTDAQLEARAAARRAKELEKNRKIKSELFVTNSDEEDNEKRDRLFFEAEEKLRQRSNIQIMKELLGVAQKDAPTGSIKSKKTKNRQTRAISLESDDELVQSSSRKRQSSAISIDSDNEEPAGSIASSAGVGDDPLVDSDEEATDTPMSSPHKPSQAKRRRVSSGDEPSSQSVVEKDAKLIVDSDEDDDVPVVKAVRQRVRAGFIMDSSDEE